MKCVLLAALALLLPSASLAVGCHVGRAVAWDLVQLRETLAGMNLAPGRTPAARGSGPRCAGKNPVTEQLDLVG